MTRGSCERVDKGHSTYTKRGLGTCCNLQSFLYCLVEWNCLGASCFFSSLIVSQRASQYMVWDKVHWWIVISCFPVHRLNIAEEYYIDLTHLNSSLVMHNWCTIDDECHAMPNTRVEWHITVLRVFCGFCTVILVPRRIKAKVSMNWLVTN